MLQEGCRRVDIINDSPVAKARPAGCDIVGAVRTVAVVKIRRGGDVTGLSQTSRHGLCELIDTALVLDYDNGGERPCAFRGADMHPHNAAVRFNLLPIGDYH
jgi:hypothetical protein